jgi:hypothetical protein
MVESLNSFTNYHMTEVDDNTTLMTLEENPELQTSSATPITTFPSHDYTQPWYYTSQYTLTHDDVPTNNHYKLAKWYVACLEHWTGLTQAGVVHR